MARRTDEQREIDAEVAHTAERLREHEERARERAGERGGGRGLPTPPGAEANA